MTLLEALNFYDEILGILYGIWSGKETKTSFKDFVMFHFHSEQKMPIIVKEWLRCKQENS